MVKDSVVDFTSNDRMLLKCLIQFFDKKNAKYSKIQPFLTKMEQNKPLYFQFIKF